MTQFFDGKQVLTSARTVFVVVDVELGMKQVTVLLCVRRLRRVIVVN